MFELTITANSIPELLEKAAALAALGVTKPVMAPEVPLPELRVYEPVTEPTAPEVVPEKPKRKYTRRAAAPTPEPEEAMHAAAEPVQETPEIEHVEPDVSETAAEPDMSHAAPGEVYLLAGDKPNNEGRQLTYIDGARHSLVMNPETSKLKTYPEHAPEVAFLAAQAALGDDGIPEHMRDENAPRSVEEAQAEIPPTQTAGVQPAESEPDTSETAMPASDDGAPPEVASGQSAPAGGDLRDHPDGKTFVDALTSAPDWDGVLVAMRVFWQTPLFKAFAPDKQNHIRASTWETCLERVRKGKLKSLPDHGADLTCFRLWLEWIEDAEDFSAADAITGTLNALKTSDQWAAAEEKPYLREACETAAAARIKELG